MKRSWFRRDYDETIRKINERLSLLMEIVAIEEVSALLRAQFVCTKYRKLLPRLASTDKSAYHSTRSLFVVAKTEFDGRLEKCILQGSKTLRDDRLRNFDFTCKYGLDSAVESIFSLIEAYHLWGNADDVLLVGSCAGKKTDCSIEDVILRAIAESNTTPREIEQEDLLAGVLDDKTIEDIFNLVEHTPADKKTNLGCRSA